MDYLWIFCALAMFVVFASAAKDQKEKKRRAEQAFQYRPEPILGNAGFATDADCKRAGLFSKRGVPCGYSTEKGKALRWDDTSMIFSVGPVGSGKDTCLVGPAMMSLDNRSLIVVGTKSETGAVFSAHRARLGPCYHVAPCGGTFAQAKGKKGARRNPMDALKNKKTRHAKSRALTESLMFRETAGGGDEKFWDGAAGNAAHVFILAVATHEPEGKKTLQRVAEIISTTEYREWAKNIISITDDPFIKQGLDTFANAHPDDRTVNGIIQTAREKLAFLRDPEMTEFMSASDFRYEDCRERVTTIFLDVPVDRQDAGQPWQHFELNEALNCLMAGGQGRVRVLVICNDYATYGAPPAVERAISVSRAFGVQLWILVQSLGQLQAKYANWQVFPANAGLQTYMTPGDQQTAAFMSEKMGVTQVSTWQKSVNFDQKDDVKEGWTCPPSARPLMHPHECSSMPESQMAVFVRGVPNVIMARRIPYFRRPEFKGKYRENPFFHRSLFKRLFT